MAGRIPSAWMDEFYARVDIVSVVSGYLPLKKDGRKYWGLCPFHHEKTPSFSVNAELNLYYCFGCKAGGNVVQFVMEMERLSYLEAVKLLADRIHMPLPEIREDPDYEKRRSQRDRLLNANKEAARYYHDLLWQPQGKAVLDYLHGRGLDDGIIRRFGLGASPDHWSDLTDFLTGKGYTREELSLAGLSVLKGDHCFDMFRNRAMFPIIDQYSHVLGFGGRALQKDAKPKYMNTTDTPVFNKRKGVYAIHLIRKMRDLKRIILVEGYMDVVALTQHGIQGVVATLGTALTNEQARLLKRYAPEVHLAYDGDEAGQHAIERGLDILETEGVPAKVLYFPDGLDPDEFIRQRGLEAFQAIRPLSAVSYRMQRLRLQFDLETADGRTEYAKKCAEALRKVQDPVDMENHLEALSVQTGFSKDVLAAQVGMPLPQEREKNKTVPYRETLSPKRVRLPESYRTEQTLLALLATGRLPEGTVKDSDFSDTTLKSIAARLLSGEKAASIIADADADDAFRQAAGETFSLLTDSEKENAPAIAQDCLRNLQIQRLQQEINKMTELMRSAETAEKRAEALAEVSALSKELAQLKQQGR